jgi:hypothetical protein
MIDNFKGFNEGEERSMDSPEPVEKEMPKVISKEWDMEM